MRPPQKPGPKSYMNKSSLRKQGADLGETDTTSGSDEDLGSGEESGHYRRNVSQAQPSTSVRSTRSLGESRQTGAERRKTIKPVKHKRKATQLQNFIHNYKKITARVDFMIPRAAFSRVVREIMMSLDTDVRYITQTAFEALQAATEAYVEGRLEDANLLAMHARRVTLMVKDLELINFLRSNGR
ncbi:histone H3.4-like [Zeugodacus cucurbitae]|uniref:histone H3.4-like n=1 Tax=Zeugodacus cucurbitae TaxID=28588 RepID=UPI000596AD20|nr:histone H3.4-like [Zeugodacus cucurbitae]